MSEKTPIFVCDFYLWRVLSFVKPDGQFPEEWRIAVARKDRMKPDLLIDDLTF